MREILFRVKRTDNSEWVEGLLWKKKYNTQKLFISCFPDKDDNEEVFVIYPETVGQYTGLTDKNGNKVFEGDIVEEVYDTHRGSRYEVRMSEERGGWYPFARDDGCGCCSWEVANCDYCEVIGNIHDNPELLKEERDRCLNGT